jgi:hypothetical protein
MLRAVMGVAPICVSTPRSVVGFSFSWAPAPDECKAGSQGNLALREGLFKDEQRLAVNQILEIDAT